MAYDGNFGYIDVVKPHRAYISERVAKQGLLLCAACMLFHFSHAQTIHRLGVESGIQHFGERDRGYSPLAYRGHRVAMGASYSWLMDGTVGEIVAHYSEGDGQSRGLQEIGLLTVGIRATMHFRIKAVRGVGLGWAAYHEYNRRKHRSFVNFSERSDYISAVGPSFRYSKEASMGRGYLSAEGTVQMLIIGVKVASDFISPDPRSRSGSEPSSRIEQLTNVVYPFRLGADIGVGFSTRVAYRFPAGHSLGVGYVWDHVRISGAHEVQRSRGQYLLSFRVKI